MKKKTLIILLSISVVIAVCFFVWDVFSLVIIIRNFNSIPKQLLDESLIGSYKRSTIINTIRITLLILHLYILGFFIFKLQRRERLMLNEDEKNKILRKQKMKRRMKLDKKIKRLNRKIKNTQTLNEEKNKIETELQELTGDT